MTTSNTKTTVNATTLFDFESTYSDTIIGERAGEGKTVKEEFAEAYRLCTRFVQSLNHLDKAKNHVGFYQVEASPEELEAMRAACLRKLETAAKKVTWLNSCCKRLTKEGFIVEKVNMRSPRCCTALVLDMYRAVCEILSNIEEKQSL